MNAAVAQEFPLTLTQRDIYFDQICHPGAPIYNIGGYLKLGAVNAARVQHAHAMLVRAHDAFGIRIVSSESGTHQRIVDEDERTLGLPIIDLSDQPTPAEAAREKVTHLFEARMPFEDAELFEALLLKLSESEYWYVVIAHHLMCDGWGFINLAHALAAHYKQGAQDQSVLCWRDIAASDESYQASERYARDRDYWRDELKALPERLLSPRTSAGTAQMVLSSVRHVVTLGAAELDRLRQAATDIGVGVPHVLLTVLASSMGLAHDQSDLVVGLPIHNRRGEAQKKAISVFASVSPMRLSVTSGLRFSEVARHVAEKQKSNFRHQRYPIGDMVRDLGLSGGHQKIYDIGFSYLNFEDDVEFDGNLSKLVYVSNNHETTPLLVTAWECGGSIEIKLDCNRNYFGESEAQLLGNRLVQLLNLVASNPDRVLALPDVLPEEERAMLLTTFNSKASEYPKDSLICELFELQAAARPQAVAVVYEDGSLTYGELNARANRLAHYLVAQGVRPDDRVAICIERGMDMIVGLLGILKSGAGYVPLDPAHPPERLSFMLADSAPKVLLTQRELRDRVRGDALPTLMLDGAPEELEPYSTQNPATRGLGVTPRHLAYVIYTSGSTGQPKGVMVEHASVINLWASLEKTVFHELPADARVGQNAPITFDASVQTLVQLLSGRTLVVIPQAARLDANLFLQYARLQRIEAFDCTPTHLDALLKAGILDETSNASLKLAVVGGEAINGAMWKTLRASRSIRFYNVYGPTECTVNAAECALREAGETPTIGRPISNTRIYILNGAGEPLPVGVIGELYIGGACVTRGYLSRDELTRERFLKDPFVSQSDARMFRTGDMGRWLPDGNIEYLGRNDFQVKINGFRIELGEIESRLAACADVREVAVLAREDTPGDKRLVAYLVPNEGASLSVADLRQRIATHLPNYMVPGAFVVLDALPQTPNGKLDRRALPAPDFSAVARQEYEAPETDAEVILAEIWQMLLGIERVGRGDHFFELGGHSMLAMRLVELLRSRGLKAEARTVFTTPLLRDYAAALVPISVSHESSNIPVNGILPGTKVILPEMLPLASLTAQEIGTITAAIPEGASNIQDIYPLLPLQEGMLFHHLMQTEQDAYVTRAVLEFDCRSRLDDFLRALNRVITRHDALRTAVLWEGLSQPVQVVLRQASLIATEMASVKAPRDLLFGRNARQRVRLDVRQAPLMAACVLQDQASDKWLLELSAHHMISDHETLALIMAEVQSLMNGTENLLPASVPLRNIVAHVRNPPLESHEVYFRQALADIEEPTAPFGVSNLRVTGSTSTTAQCRVSPALSRRIRDCARRLGVPSSALFHTAWALVLARCTGRTDVVFGTVLSGRMQADAGFAHAIGLLINTLPVRISLARLPAGNAVLKCQDRLASLLAHERAPLNLALQCSGVPSPLPLFTSLLNYRHSLPQEHGEPLPLTLSGVRVLLVEESANYPIAVQVDDYGEEFSLSAICVDGLDAERITGYFRSAIENVARALEDENSEDALTLDILPPGERQQLLADFNHATSDYTRTALVHELFEAQVRVRPDSVAVVHRDEVLDYAALNARANQLAHYLGSLGVKPDDRVAVCLRQGVDMVISLLAVLKAGGCYVPLDSNYPQERIRHMLSDSAPVALLTQLSLTELVGTHALPTLVLDAPSDREALKSQPTHDPVKSPDLNDSHLAYVIYTSGSTGEPKGVMVEHHSVVRLVTTRDYVQLDSSTVMAQASNTSFDAATFEIWGALLNGGRLVVVEKDTLINAERLAAQIHEDGITVLFVTTALFNHHAQSKPDCFAGLGTLLFGGEAVSPGAVATVVRKGMPKRLLHVYGPTETTTFSAWYPVTSEPLAGAVTVPIGRGFADTRLYVLTPTLQPVPVGVAGELFVAGAGLARGYLDRDELSAERFLKDPFARELGASDASARMYKTGDLVRWLPDGSLEFLGRRDSQIKLRGFRIELGEIESKLAAQPNVREALVLLREDVPGDKRLVAYLTCHDETSFSAAQVQAHLVTQLPDYMLPSAFVVLDAFPLTPNGKLDRKALPVPEGESLAAEYEPPEGHTEEALAEIWRELLRVPRVGRHDNFSALGGHSLLAITLSVRILEKFQIQLPLEALFGAASLVSMSELIVNAQANLFSEKEVEEMEAELASMSDEDLLAYLKDLK
jgi:arthrofactin-type cyclic lipopeptide synthetase A